MTTQFAPRQGTKFAKGKRGDWFADVRNGERLPCLHLDNLRFGQRYVEAFYYDPGKPKHAKYIEALRQGRAILTRDERVSGRNGFGEGRYRRLGYVESIIKVADVVNDPINGLSLRIVGSASA